MSLFAFQTAPEPPPNPAEACAISEVELRNLAVRVARERFTDDGMADVAICVSKSVGKLNATNELVLTEEEDRGFKRIENFLISSAQRSRGDDRFFLKIVEATFGPADFGENVSAAVLKSARKRVSVMNPDLAGQMAIYLAGAGVLDLGLAVSVAIRLVQARRFEQMKPINIVRQLTPFIDYNFVPPILTIDVSKLPTAEWLEAVHAPHFTAVLNAYFRLGLLEDPLLAGRFGDRFETLNRDPGNGFTAEQRGESVVMLAPFTKDRGPRWISQIPTWQHRKKPIVPQLSVSLVNFLWQSAEATVHRFGTSVELSAACRHLQMDPRLATIPAEHGGIRLDSARLTSAISRTKVPVTAVCPDKLVGPTAVDFIIEQSGRRYGIIITDPLGAYVDRNPARPMRGPSAIRDSAIRSNGLTPLYLPYDVVEALNDDGLDSFLTTSLVA